MQRSNKGKCGEYNKFSNMRSPWGYPLL